MQDSDVQGLERLLARLMLGGVQLSAACLVAGLALSLLVPGFHQASWLLTAGLITLMATPMLRVAISVVEAVRLKDWAFVLTTATVAVLLAAGVVYSLLL